MKKIIVVTLFTLLLGLSFNAFAADEGWYMGGNIGMVSVDDSDLDFSTQGMPAGSIHTGELDYDLGFLLGVAAGYDFEGVRVEGALEYQKNDADNFNERQFIPSTLDSSTSTNANGDVAGTSLLLNVYYDFMRCCELRPFIMAGIGVSKVDADMSGIDDDDTVFAYRLGAGLSYDVNEKVIIDFTYRYFGTSDPDFDDVEAEYSGHSLLFGARFYF